MPQPNETPDEENQRRGRLCANCRWFVAPQQGSGPGECRRFPRYEQRRQTEWCGEFKG